MILAPQRENARRTVERVRSRLGSVWSAHDELDAREHDAIFAAVSHLPHVVAFALVSMLAKRYDAERCSDFPAAAFATTRIAGSHPEMWRDICIANRDA